MWNEREYSFKMDMHLFNLVNLLPTVYSDKCIEYKFHERVTK